MRVRAALVACVCLCLAWAACPGAQGSAASIPIRRVVLYKAGVGYFEHLARIVGTGDLTMQFTSRQLDDALKSLTAIDLDNGRVSGITYDSTAPIDQRIALLGIQLPPQADRAEFYRALRGTRVTVTQGAAQMTGRLLGVERRATSEYAGVDELTLVADDGRIRTFGMNANLNVRIADAALRDDVDQYLSLVGSRQAQEIRRVTINDTGTGVRRVLVSYISEVPVWKSTYRVVFDPDQNRPLLQGWAIVDNTMAEDWTNVDLSLVAGAPQSFVQNISQPYYVSRPVVGLPRQALLQPQTHEPTLQLDERVAVSGAGSVMDRAGAGSGLGAGRASGLSGGIVGGVNGVPLPPPAAPAAPPAAQLIPSATGQALSDLFEYHVQQPITIRRNQSALVPIINAPIDAERVALWRPNLPDNRPLRALWITNSTSDTLDGGSFSVMDGGAFAGEGLIEPLKPAEKRLISYGVDLGVLVSAKNDPGPQRVTRLAAAKGVIAMSQEERSIWTYTLRNTDSSPRSLVIEHPVKAGWTIEPNEARIENSASEARFKLTLDAHKDMLFIVRERRAIASNLSIAQFDAAQLASLVARGASDEELRKVFAPIFAKRAEVASADDGVKAANASLSRITDDEQRLRANITTLGGSKDDRAARQRYTSALARDEDALSSLQADLKRLIAERDARQAELNDMIASLAFDVATAS